MTIEQKDTTGIFLALTSLEEFWDISCPILFLGEWCKDYKKKELWRNIHAIELASEKINHIDSYEAYQHAATCYENLFPKIARWLNDLHDTTHSQKYWRLLVGPFLFWYIQVVYERFLRLKAAHEQYPDLETYGLSHDAFLTPIHTNEFTCLSGYNDKWNLQIFTQLLELAYKKPILYKTVTWEHELNQREIAARHAPYKLRTKFLLSIFRFLNKCKQLQMVGVIDGFSHTDLINIMFSSKFRIVPVLPTMAINRGQALARSTISRDLVNMKLRNQLLTIVADDELSRLVINTLPVNMPVNFVEGYHHEVLASRKYFPYRSKVIMLESCASYDQYKFWIGEQLEKGSRLVGYQHGGCYGMQKASSAEFLERHTSDFFISWGWNSGENVKDAPALVAQKKIAKYFRHEKRTELNEILWITTFYNTKYQISIHDWWIKAKPYFHYQKRFFSVLPSNILSHICMRIDPSNTNIEEIRENFPELNIYLPNDRNSFFPHLDRAKIAVIDNVSTPFLYVLAFNIPAILFWDKNYWVFRDEAKPYLDALEQVGIYYHSPEEAAAMLNKIADDPYPWWFSKPVQLARKQFCDQFIKTSENYLQEWRDILLQI